MRFLPFVLFLSLLASAGWAQSLAEIAEKEKKRRASNGETVKVITDAELDDDADESDDERSPTDTDDATPTSSAAASRPTESDGSPARHPEIASRQDAWPALFADFQERYRDKKAEREKLLPIKKECESSAAPIVPSGYALPPSWGVGPEVCKSLPGRFARIEAELKEIQAECFDEARKHYVSPSTAKLR